MTQLIKTTPVKRTSFAMTLAAWVIEYLLKFDAV